MAVTTIGRPISKEVKSEVVDIHPTVATAWMDKNLTNRPRSAKVISAYARDMKSGSWMWTGDPIRFDDKGNLIDGQHRLLACIEADVPFRSTVIYGLPSITQNVIDANKPRRATDVLAMHGYNNPIVLNTAARWLMAYKVGYERTNAVQPSNSEVMDLIRVNKHLPASVNAARKARGIYPGLAGFIHYIGAHVLDKQEEADAFLEVFKSGIPSRKGCPAHKVRERLLRDLRGSGSQGLLKREHHFRLVVHAWNLFVSDEKIDGQLRIPATVEIEGVNRAKLKIR